MRHTACSILSLVAAIQTGAAGQPEFFQSIRNDDLGAVTLQLERGADLTAKDSTGATALMYAALYSSPACVQLLLERGADPNAANNAGATALMWGAGDPVKVRLLLARGSQVNAKARSGRTALIIASSVNGNVESVKMLLKGGADLKARDNLGMGPVMAASEVTDAAILAELVAHKADPNEHSALRGQSALMNAAGYGSVQAVKVLLEAGADANAQSLEPVQVKTGLQDRGKLTALLWAAPFADREMIRLLLSKGADPNVRDYRGMNALILASSSESVNVDVVRMLLPKTADVNSRDKSGLTALDWAMKFGDTPVVRVLRQAGVKSSEATRVEQPRPPTGTTDIRQAVQKSVALMKHSNTEFFKASGCLGCHSFMLGGMLSGLAKDRGLAVDKSTDTQQLKAILASRMSERESIFQHQRPGGYPMALSLLLVSLDAQKYPSSALTDAFVHTVLAGQQADGSWHGFDQRPPSEYSVFSETAYAIRAILAYAPPGRRTEVHARVQRAASWLSSAKAVSTEEKVMRLLGLGWAHAPEARLAELGRELLAEQRDGGGWAQRDGFASDAYATGQVLYAVSQAAHVPSSHEAYQRGVRYLLSTQYDDGSWLVLSRSAKFQPFFESGFPHGHDQWISAAGTSWAAMALALAVEPPAVRAGVEAGPKQPD